MDIMEIVTPVAGLVIVRSSYGQRITFDYIHVVAKRKSWGNCIMCGDQHMVIGEYKHTQHGLSLETHPPHPSPALKDSRIVLPADGIEGTIRIKGYSPEYGSIDREVTEFDSNANVFKVIDVVLRRRDGSISRSR